MSRAEPWRWEELSKSEQRGVEGEMDRIGRSTRSNSEFRISHMRERAGGPVSEAYKEKLTSSASRLEAVTPYLQDKSVTLRRAGSRRVSMWNQAVQHSRESGESLGGAGWYFDHAQSVHDVRGRIPFDQAATATAALSPGKDPKKDELQALRVLSDLHNEPHTITMGRGRTAETMPVAAVGSERLGSYLSQQKTEVAAGRRPPFGSSHPELHVGGRAHKRNTVKAIKVIRGEIGSAQANPPHTSPKVASYERAIVSAGTASSAEHLDYMGIAHHVVHGDPHQGMLQFSGGGETPRSSILSPEHHTAEDTWMQAITSGQRLKAPAPERGGRPLRPAKRAVDKDAPGEQNALKKTPAGLRRDPALTPEAAVHAFNSRATQEAAARVGPVSHNQHGEAVHVPSVMMQEVSWTQARRSAGADPTFNASQRRRQDVFKDAGQRKLF